LAALIVAGGTGTRFGAPLPKQFVNLAGKPVIQHTLERFLELHPALQVVVVMHADFLDMFQDLVVRHLHDAFASRIETTAGGPQRTDSVRNGLALLQHLPAEALIAVQDAVRPFANPPMLAACYMAAAKHGSGVAAVASKSSLRQALPGGGSVAVDRDLFFAVQTPQTFRADVLRHSYTTVRGEFTDDAGLVEAAGHAIHLVTGAYDNLKITTPEDLQLAELLWPLFAQKWL
jgi:2-C-methyl-D-erythritol 4-phosphate cytidylyltransferase